ncbi:MAG: hypothetical protein RL150_396 [Candidatus Parcubacteria bacterium]|jgi:hypothetical protein
MMRFTTSIPTCAGILILCAFLMPAQLQAQALDVYAPELIPNVSLLISPQTASFVEDSTFDVPIILNTRGNSVNSVNVKITYDTKRFSIVGPSGKTSIIGVWVEPPAFNNATGVATYTGVIPGGITTSSGVISAITFKAKTPGQGSITISNDSEVLLNDGFGTKAKVDFGRATYSVVAKPAAGVPIFSDTHPVQRDWYNNKNPIFSWSQETGVTAFSYELNTIPNTVPDNTPDTTQTTVQFPDLADGIWHFHIKALKNGVWGNTGTFAARIDTTPPAIFTPTVEYMFEGNTEVKRALVSFFTTDNASGVDRYEVGIIDNLQPTTVSPIFVETGSPFQIPLQENANLRVIVRAFDTAGNIREAHVDVQAPLFISNIFKEYWIHITAGVLGILVMIGMLHYIFHHHILRHLHRAVEAFNEDDNRPTPPQQPPVSPSNSQYPR